MIYEQNENINTETNFLKNNKIKIMELKSVITELKNSLQGFNIRLDKEEEIISKLKGR